MMNTNLLDLNNDILNIIGDYVKKDNLEQKLNEEEQILNGKKITFGGLRCHYHPYDENPYDNNGYYLKDNIKRYLFHYLDAEILELKEYAKIDKIKLTKPDIRMCIWVLFQRYKLILDDYKLFLNMEDENNYLDEYLTKKKLNLKSKKYSFNY